MNFNVERLCELAGLDSKGRLLSEGMGHKAYEDDAAAGGPPPPTPKAATPPAKGSGLVGAPAKKAEGHGMGHKGHGGKGHTLMDLEELEDDDIGADAGLDASMLEDDETYHEDDETVYEIDEQELNEAIYKMRTQRIEEGRVRQQVRKELRQVVNEMGSGTSWMYGDRKPTNSKPGSIGRGFVGPGFKR